MESCKASAIGAVTPPQAGSIVRISSRYRPSSGKQCPPEQAVEMPGGALRKIALGVIAASSEYTAGRPAGVQAGIAFLWV